MGFLADVLLIGVVCLLLFIYVKRPVSGAFFALGVQVLSIVAAFFLSLPLSGPCGTYLIGPALQKQAAYELADLSSDEHLSSGYATVEKLEVDRLITEAPEPYRQILQRYGVTQESVFRAYTKQPSPRTFLDAITGRFTDELSRACTFVMSWIVLFLLLTFLSRRIQRNMRLPREPRGFLRLVTAGSGLISAVFILWALTLLMTLSIPFLAQRILFVSEDMLRESSVYTVFYQINPFAWLLF